MKIDETLIGWLLVEALVLAFFVFVLMLLGAPVWGAAGLGFLCSQVTLAEANR